MLDTVRLESPEVKEDVAAEIEKFCTRFQGIAIKTGEMLYEFTKGSLQGSWDSKIMLKIEREKWVDDIVEHLKTGKATVIKVDCGPRIIVEASVHKAMLGHNVFGGPKNFRYTMKWLISFIENTINKKTKKIKLPDYLEWFVKRIDVAEVFDLGSYEAVSEYFRGMNSCSFPRRPVIRYGESGIYAKGKTTTVKGYHKGPAYQKQDFKRIASTKGLNEAKRIQEIANKLIRFEVEIHYRKLKNDFGIQPKVKDITIGYLNNIFDMEVSKLVRDSKKASKLCRTAEAVEKKLYQSFTTDLAARLLGTWYRLSVHGESYVKKTMPKATFYRHRKLLVDSGVSWIATNVILKEFTLVPVGFSPIRKDSRRLMQVDKEVIKALRSVA